MGIMEKLKFGHTVDEHELSPEVVPSPKAPALQVVTARQLSMGERTRDIGTHRVVLTIRKFVVGADLAAGRCTGVKNLVKASAERQQGIF